MIRSVKHGGVTVEYELRRTARTNVMLKVFEDGSVRVLAPERAHLRDLDAFVRDNIPKILEARERLRRSAEASRLSHPVAENSRVSIEGESYALRRVRAKEISLRIEGDTCILALEHPDDEDAVRAALRSALSGRMLERIRERLSYYAPRVGVSFGRVTIRDQKTRWGSCSSKGNLNFNWKLIMAPKEVLDYVVVHELCHRVEFNHSPRFWRLVEAQLPDYALSVKWLREHGRELGVGD